jgi:uncharacterized RDD family membrane protein YckC
MQKISVGLRLGTMLLDHAIICFIGIPPLIIYTSISGSDNSSIASIPPYPMILLFVIYFCKDCIGGRSPAKRILKLAVLDNRTNNPASSFQSLVRNLFILIWPIEVIVVLFNQERRIADIVAGTKLSHYNPSTENKTNIAQLCACILLASAISYLLILPFEYI